MTEMSEQPILIEDRNGVRWITINRPDAANAIDDAVADGFVAGLAAATADPSVRAVVLTGAGQRVFSAGVDLKNPLGLSKDDVGEARRRRTTGCLAAVVSFEKPLVAALNGVTSGAGCMIALLTDWIVAADHVSLVLPEIDVGMPCFLGLEIVTRLAGEALAADLVLSGRRLPAEEGKQHGLVRAVAPLPELRKAAQAAAEMLGAKPALPFALDKRWLNDSRRAGIERAGAESLRVRALLHANPEPRTAHAMRFEGG
jgi:enoyl-CoA hydratase/carnithine racemase